MPTPGKTHDLARVTLIIGGYTITGYGEGGAISVEPLSPAMESSVGQDGQATYARSNDHRAKVTITVRQNSRAHRDLHALQVAQDQAPVPANIAFLLIAADTGERIADSQALFMERPAIAFQRAPQDRVYVLELPNGFAPGNYDAAPLVVQ